MRQIIILDLEVDLANSQGRATAVFWLVAPLNRIRPIPNAKSLVPTATAYAAWQASHVYAAGAIVVPTSANVNGLAYTASAGTGGSTEPTWPTTPGGTVVSGGVTFTANMADLNSGLTAAELLLLQSGQVVEVFWQSQEETSLALLQTEIQTAYGQLQTNLTGSTFTSRLFLSSWNGSAWSASL